MGEMILGGLLGLSLSVHVIVWSDRKQCMRNHAAAVEESKHWRGCYEHTKELLERKELTQPPEKAQSSVKHVLNGPSLRRMADRQNITDRELSQAERLQANG